MKLGSVLHVVGVQCKPGLEEKFQQWYSEVHVPMLLKFPGLKSITQYQITKPDAKYPSFLATYEFDSVEAFEKYERSDELAASRKQADETWAEGDQEIKWRVQYSATRTWQR